MHCFTNSLNHPLNNPPIKRSAAAYGWISDMKLQTKNMLWPEMPLDLQQEYWLLIHLTVTMLSQSSKGLDTGHIDLA